MSDDISELRRDISDMVKAQAVHHERMENYQDRIIEKLDALVKKNGNGNGTGWSPPRTSSGGISPKFVLQVIGLLLGFVIILSGGPKTVDALVSWGTHLVESKVGGK